MQLKNGTFCPFIKKDCVGLTCTLFTRVQGYDINTGNQVDEYQCAIAWLPTLLIENSGQQRQTGAAVESFRNEMVKSNETSQKVLLASLGFQGQRDQITTIQNSPPENRDIESKTFRSR
jgi:uncharacterized protein YjiK